MLDIAETKNIRKSLQVKTLILLFLLQIQVFHKGEQLIKYEGVRWHMMYEWQKRDKQKQLK